MRDIGGKAFDCINPAAQGSAHVGQRAREQPDFIAAFGQARHFDSAVTAEPHADSGADQRAQRLDDGAGQEQRELDRDQQGHRQ